MKRKIYLLFALFFLLSDVFAQGQPRVRPQHWAQQMIGSSLKNWYKVDFHLYRSEQPNKSEFIMLRNYGVAAVLTLRDHHSDEKMAKGSHLKLYSYRLSTRKMGYSDLVRILKIIHNEKSPILVHCWHGSDRTGAVVAAYRIAYHNWTKEEALDELLHGGFGYHAVFKNIPDLILSIDEKQIRADVRK